MNRWLLLSIVCAGLVAQVRSTEWSNDAEAAKAQAKRENKVVLLDFTGSDWCSWCIKLKKEVFDQPEFAEFARANFVLVEVDFPHHNVMSPAQQQANRKLANAYHVNSYPSIVLVDGDGHVLGRTGYVAGGPAAFDAKLEHLLKLDRKVPPHTAQAVPEPTRKTFVWTPAPTAVPVHYGALTLKGISGTGERRMVLINNASLMTGEIASVKVEDGEVKVRCQEIRDDSVLVVVADKTIDLKLGQH
jgi:thioredoxin-related protein